VKIYFYIFIKKNDATLDFFICIAIFVMQNFKKIKNMNKSDLIDSMAKAAGTTKVQAAAALDAFMLSTQGALKKNDKVILVGFGTFSVTKRAARKGRNPQTGAEINIPAKKVVKFKAGANLQAKVK